MTLTQIISGKNWLVEMKQVSQVHQQVQSHDGEVVWERDPTTGKEILFKEIDQSKIKFVDILNPIEDIDDLLKEEVKTRVKNSRGDTVEMTFNLWMSHLQWKLNRNMS